MLQNISLKNEIMIYEDIISAVDIHRKAMELVFILHITLAVLIKSIPSTFFFLLTNYKSEKNQIKIREKQERIYVYIRRYIHYLHICARHNRYCSDFGSVSRSVLLIRAIGVR